MGGFLSQDLGEIDATESGNSMKKKLDRYQSIEGELTATDLRFGFVVARFNRFISERLLAGALDAVERSGGNNLTCDVVWVPGSREIPVAAKEMGNSGLYDSVVCLGAVIRGETTHYDYVAHETSTGIGQAGLDTGVPTIFGVLTCDTLEQAINRAGAKGGNKGFEAAMAAIEMANLLKELRSEPNVSE